VAGVSPVVTQRAGAVLTVTLNRSEALNAITLAMQEALVDALAEAAAGEVRAVVLTGAGRAFSVGQDLAEFPPRPQDVGELVRDYYNRNLLALRGLEKPVLAAVNGPAAGAGLGLALACDMRLLSDTATLVPAFCGIGLVPDSGVSQTLPALIGRGRAFAWLADNRRLAAAEAVEWGLAERVVPADELPAAAAELAAQLAAMPTRALAMTKRLLEQAPHATLAEQLEAEAGFQAEAAATEDFAEGVRAFLDKRPARFTGS
jgi:2-(1,2-epoxy-1,2-dihydrophenyl)acetyl-CoA isomerase